MNLSNKTTISFLILLIISIIGLCFLIMNSTLTQRNESITNNCKLVATKPTFPYDIENVAPEDFKALVKIAAYLRYTKKEDDKNIYMPIERPSISFTEKSDGLYNLVIKSKCVSIKIPINVTIGYEYYLTRFKVHMNPPNGKFSDCSLVDSEMWIPSTERYSSPPLTQYYCTNLVKDGQRGESKPKIIAIMVFEQLEFEIFGNKTEIKKCKFSKPPHLPYVFDLYPM